MRLKIYAAATMREAMQQVRAELGDAAVIVSSQSGADGTGVRVTAAVDDAGSDAGEAQGWEDEGGGAEGGAEVGQALAYHAVPPPIAERLIETAEALAGEGALIALAGALDATLEFLPLSDAGGPRRLMLIGPPGVGKTLAVAKLATRQRRAGRGAAVITCDTRRAGGIDQLQAFARILGVDLITAASPKELAAALLACDGPAYIDTSGTNPFSGAEMETLARFVEAAPVDPILVVAAGGDATETAEMAAAFAGLGARRVVASRLDVSRRLGGVLAAAATPGLALSAVSVSHHAADALSPINPVSLARLILPHAAAVGKEPSRTPLASEALP